MKLHLPSRPPRRGAVICGAYGMDNAGDDAVLTAIVAQLRRIDGDMPITVLAHQPKKTAARFGVENTVKLPINPTLAAACDRGMVEDADVSALWDFSQKL